MLIGTYYLQNTNTTKNKDFHNSEQQKKIDALSSVYNIQLYIIIMQLNSICIIICVMYCICV